MDKINCIRCKAENNDDYKFCINCGAHLPKNHSIPFRENTCLSQNDPPTAAEPLDFDGVSSAEMTAYIEKNADKILPKMYNMQKYNQRVSFCFPVFFLGLLLGFIGISMWCFYRKMKKLGFIFLFLGLFFALGDLIVNLSATTQLISGHAKLLAEFFANSQAINPIFPAAAFEEIFARYNDAYIGIFSFLNQYVGGIIAPVLMGMFGLHFYKTKALLDIKEIKNTIPSAYVFDSIAEKGGTSGGLLSIPIIFYILIFIVSFVLLLVLL